MQHLAIVWFTVPALSTSVSHCPVTKGRRSDKCQDMTFTKHRQQRRRWRQYIWWLLGWLRRERRETSLTNRALPSSSRWIAQLERGIQIGYDSMQCMLCYLVAKILILHSKSRKLVRIQYLIFHNCARASDRGGMCTVLVLRMARRIWTEIKQQPGTAGPGNMLGSCLVSFHFLSCRPSWARAL